jgi:hypothetical protein
MKRYAAAAKEPKTVLFYDSAHDLNDPQALKAAPSDDGSFVLSISML